MRARPMSGMAETLMVARPSRMLERRSLVAALGAAGALPQSVTRRNI
jgi:hypothetical protein